MALIAGNQYRVEYNDITGEEEWRMSKIWVFITVLPMIWMAGNREKTIGDTSAYIANFLAMPSLIEDIPLYLSTVEKDWGFSVFSIIVKFVIGNNYVIYLSVIAFIQLFILSRFYRKYSSDFYFSVFLFVASADYYGWVFNGIRQFLAVTITLWATPSILRFHKEKNTKDLIKIVFIVLLASTVHRTALIMLPILFIVQGEAFSRRTMIAIVVAIVAVAFAGKFNSILLNIFETTEYAAAFSEYAGVDDGVNPIRVLVYSIPVIIALVNRRKLALCENTLIDLCVNMSILTAGLYLIGMVSSGILLGRLPIYCSLYNYILLPWELSVFLENARGISKMATIVGYIAYCVYAIGIIQ